MTVNEIEQLATKFAEALKEITPHAIDLAQQMFVLRALQDWLMLLPLSVALWFVYKKIECAKSLSCSYDDEAGKIILYFVGIVLGLILMICVSSVIHNSTNAMFPEAALLGKLIR